MRASFKPKKFSALPGEAASARTQQTCHRNILRNRVNGFAEDGKIHHPEGHIFKSLLTESVRNVAIGNSGEYVDFLGKDRKLRHGEKPAARTSCFDNVYE